MNHLRIAAHRCAGLARVATFATAAAVVTGTTLAGCGQTGPLYFDEDPPADQLPPSRKGKTSPPVPAPAAPASPDQAIPHMPPPQPVPPPPMQGGTSGALPPDRTTPPVVSTF